MTRGVPRRLGAMFNPLSPLTPAILFRGNLESRLHISKQLLPPALLIIPGPVKREKLVAFFLQLQQFAFSKSESSFFRIDNNTRLRETDLGNKALQLNLVDDTEHFSLIKSSRWSSLRRRGCQTSQVSFLTFPF